jgi:hypothetical protein
MPVIRIASFEDLTTFLTESGRAHEVDADQKLIVLPVHEPPLSGQMLIRWEKQLPYVQIIHPLEREVPIGRRSDVEHAICRANNTIALPGFGFEYTHNFIYFRLTVPMYDEGMLARSFRRQMEAVVKNARDFVIPFQQIVAGEPGEKILGLAVTAAKAVPA